MSTKLPIALNSLTNEKLSRLERDWRGSGDEQIRPLRSPQQAYSTARSSGAMGFVGTAAPSWYSNAP